MLVPQGEGSGTPTEPHHTPSPKAQQTSSTTPSSLTLPSVTTSSALPPIADEPASPLRDVSEGKAFPTDSGFKADQDRANIAKSSTLPHDSIPRVTSLAADEGTQELEINRLKARVKLLEDRKGLAAAERVSDDTEEMATVLTSMDEATVLASGVAKVPTGSGSIPTAGPPAAEVPTGSDMVSTAGLIFATATVVTPYTRTKGQRNKGRV
nr:hypothetical protein [Tanacetum cinerariifolium]